MKNLTFCIMTSFLLLSFMPFQLKAETEKSTTTSVTAKSVEPTDANADAAKVADASLETSQLARLEEIKSMDKSELTASEKKALREEVQSIQRDEDRRDRNSDRDHRNYDGRHHGGVFILGGGGLLILILLLLLL